MDTDMQPTTGAAPPPAELSALLNRLLDEAEGTADAPPPADIPTASQPIPTPSAPAPAAPAPSASAPSASAPAVGASLAGGGGLGTLLANPALLSALPTLAENLSPLLGAMSRGTGGVPSAARPPSVDRPPSVRRPHTVDRHTALLCAVKPYLSPRRQEAAETVIRLCRIWDALERSGISLSGLLSGLDRFVPTGHTPAAESSPTAESSPLTGDSKEVT